VEDGEELPAACVLDTHVQGCCAYMADKHACLLSASPFMCSPLQDHPRLPAVPCMTISTCMACTGHKYHANAHVMQDEIIRKRTVWIALGL